MDPTDPPYRYVVDRDDRIAQVNAPWLRFARDNGAAHLTAEAVVGSSLWSHMRGEAVIALYRHLFGELRARAGEVVIPFRCDSPDRMRHMLMTTRAVRGAAIVIDVHMVRSEARDPVMYRTDSSAADAAESYPICAVCRQVRVDAGWMELTRALVQERMTSTEASPTLIESLCARCERKLTRAAAGHTGDDQ